MTKNVILTDLNRCVGCLACMVACKSVNPVPVGEYYSKILRVGPYKKPEYVNTNDVTMYYLPVGCQHCANPACVDICPTGASYVAEDGSIQIDAEICIGCKACMTACPYGVRFINAETSVAQKCALCSHITPEGGLPQCVVQCGGRARYFGDIEQGIENLEAPGICYSADRENNDCSYDLLYTKNRIKFGDAAKPYDPETEVHQFPNAAGTDPSFIYVLRGREWKEDVL